MRAAHASAKRRYREEAVDVAFPDKVPSSGSSTRWRPQPDHQQPNRPHGRPRETGVEQNASGGIRLFAGSGRARRSRDAVDYRTRRDLQPKSPRRRAWALRFCKGSACSRNDEIRWTPFEPSPIHHIEATPPSRNVPSNAFVDRFRRIASAGLLIKRSDEPGASAGSRRHPERSATSRPARAARRRFALQTRRPFFGSARCCSGRWSSRGCC